jgi:predicted kinase
VSPRIVLVAGLAGSGKTPYLARLGAEGWIAFDDFKANSRMNLPHLRNAPRYDELIQALRDGRNCVIADMGFCRSRDRHEAESILRKDVPSVTIEWQFFENDPQQCAENIRCGTRPAQPRLAKVEEFTALYSIPPGAAMLPVWRDGQ